MCGEAKDGLYVLYAKKYNKKLLSFMNIVIGFDETIVKMLYAYGNSSACTDSFVRLYYRFISISTPSIPSKHTHIFPSTSENIRKNSFIIMMLHSHNQLTFMSEVFPWQKKNVPEKTFSF